MNRNLLPIDTRNSQENIWENYDPKRVLAALKKSEGILKGFDRTTLLKEIANQRKQKSNGRSV